MITKINNKKWVKTFMVGVISFLFPLSSFLFTSCSDILETESIRQNIEPTIEQKTDSVFYAYGILQAMQELADQYVFQGEMRGDLVKTTEYTDNNLRQLANFSATTNNKYDSAYVYYRVINNCNYYIAHCDTNLYNGATNVIIDKYAAAMAIRAWAYLQLGRNYEKVPFFTEPLTKISQIDAGYPELSLNEIVAQLAPELEKYTGFKVPTFGYPSTTQVSAGNPNWGSEKKFLPRLCFIPVDVVLSDMYLEVGNYDQAARHLVTYFTRVSNKVTSNYIAPLTRKNTYFDSDEDIPDGNLISVTVSGTSWNTLFSINNIEDIVTYIPMASTAMNGKTTNVPLTFGFDYYATPDEKQRSGEPYVDEIQLLPSDQLNLLSDSTEYYYYASHASQIDKYDDIRISRAGDMRLRSIIHQERDGDSVRQWIDKYKYANIILYRNSTLWLRLAECLNRLGMPDAAFAILKDGIMESMLAVNSDGSYKMDYLSDESRAKLRTVYPLLTNEFLNKLFEENTSEKRNSSLGVVGIHAHGAGKAASDYPGGSATGGTTYHTGLSPYNFDRIVGKKLQEIADVYGVNVGTTKQDTINAMEDIICDELALETAFEGNRYFDLMRMARHKNADSPAGHGANFGYLWIQNGKLKGRGWDESKMYLPFK